jgi:RimJ/RimL family protein N-acetyltransferase
MNYYKCLKNREFANGEFRLIPIRLEDRYEIMKWRNEQIYHLRQKEQLTIEQQDAYFEKIVAKLFNEEQPNQILFSFLKNEELIGYGGLVHINWSDLNAEVSFLTKNAEELTLWEPFLNQLKRVAFEELDLNKIYTYSYDIRQKLYPNLEAAEFLLEGVMSNNINKQNRIYDVRLHSCFNNKRDFWSRHANLSDASMLFNWVNDPEVRSQSMTTDLISWPSHLEWMFQKILHQSSRIYIYFNKNEAIGNLRLDMTSYGYKISYLVDAKFRGQGYGKQIIMDAIERSQGKLIAEVKVDNIGSNKIFDNMGFTLSRNHNHINTWTYVK